MNIGMAKQKAKYKHTVYLKHKQFLKKPAVVMINIVSLKLEQIL